MVGMLRRSEEDVAERMLSRGGDVVVGSEGVFLLLSYYNYYLVFARQYFNRYHYNFSTF